MSQDIELLLKAIGSGDLRVVKRLTKKDPTLLNTIIRPGRNRDYRPLTEAAVECQLDILSYLIDSGCDVNEDDRYPMFRAALYDRCVPALEMLVENGTEVNGVWADYGPPIIASCEGMSLKTMEWLLENGAKITGTGKGKSEKVPWNTLVHAGHFDKHRRGLLALLIEHGCDVNSQHRDGRNGKADTALHSVARKGDVTAVRLLLKNGANPGLKDDDGLRAIDLTKNKQVRALLG
jgi:hypothetical protein